MSIGFSFTVLVMMLVLLGFSSARVVKLLAGISSLLKIPKFLLSFVIIGLGTSMPDLLISSISASQGQVELMLASIIGANIVLLCVVLGIVTIRKGVFQVREQSVLENFGWIFFVIIIPFFLLLDGRLTSLEGVILIALYGMYLYHVKEEEPLARKEEEQTHQVIGFGLHEHSKARLVAELLVFLVVAVIASHFIVDTAVDISSSFNIHPLLMGFLVIALGIAIPELALDLNALQAREEEVIWGDLIGSFITELTLVLGVASIVGGVLVFKFLDFIVGYGFMVLAFVLVFFFAYRKKALSRAEGVLLLLLYVIFVSVQVDLVHVAPLDNVLLPVP